MKIFLFVFLGTLGLYGQEKTIKEIFSATQERLKNTNLYFKGARVFDQMCTHCHGRSGRGNGPWAETLTTKPRNFRLGHFKFRTTPYGRLPSDNDLRRTIRHGITGTAMPTFAKMSESDLDAVIAFIQGLSPRWKHLENYAVPIKIPEVPAWNNAPAEATDHIKTGKKQFGISCASCHGTTGEGDGPASKGLVNAEGHPIKPASFTGENFKSCDKPSDLYRTIAMGLDGTPMIGHKDLLKSDEIWNLVAYLQKLEK